MSRRRHVPPSRLRYEQENPTISVRVTLDLYTQLKAIKEQGGLSVGDILREAMGVQVNSVQVAFDRGNKQGKMAAEKLYRLDYRCAQCGGTITLTSAGEKKAVAGYMREHGWAHKSCLE